MKPMKLEHAFFARAVEIDARGVFSVLSGGLNTVEAAELPYTIPTLSLLIRIGAETAADTGQFRLLLQMFDPDGTECFEKAEMPFTLQNPSSPVCA